MLTLTPQAASLGNFREFFGSGFLQLKRGRSNHNSQLYSHKGDARGIKSAIASLHHTIVQSPGIQGLYWLHQDISPSS